MDFCSVLPEELVLSYILPYLSIVDLAECKLVCTRWLEMVRRYYKSLKELDLTPWDFMVTEDYLVNIIMHGQLLRIIRLSKCWRASTATAVFLVANTCSRLQVLHISHCGSLTDQAVEDVARKCKELKEVDMSSCYKITDAAMCSLADHAKNLEELYVSSVYGVTDFGVSQLSFKGLSLKTLDVSYCFRVSDKGLVGILKRPQGTNLIKSLRIKGCAKIRLYSSYGKLVLKSTICSERNNTLTFHEVRISFPVFKNHSAETMLASSLVCIRVVGSS